MKNVNTMHYTAYTTYLKDKVREFNHVREENAVEIQFINFEVFKFIQIHLISAN